MAPVLAYLEDVRRPSRRGWLRRFPATLALLALASIGPSFAEPLYVIDRELIHRVDPVTGERDGVRFLPNAPQGFNCRRLAIDARGTFYCFYGSALSSGRRTGGLSLSDLGQDTTGLNDITFDAAGNLWISRYVFPPSVPGIARFAFHRIDVDTGEVVDGWNGTLNLFYSPALVGIADPRTTSALEIPTLGTVSLLLLATLLAAVGTLALRMP